jgi:HEAT repeat protein
MGSPAAIAASEFSKNLSIALDSSQTLRQRIIAIHYLGSTGEERAAGPLLSILTNPVEQEGLRCTAARALTDLGEARSEIIPAFEKVYQEPESGRNLKYTILLSLGRMRGSEALPMLSAALSDSSPMIRFKASQAVGELKSDESVRLLTSHLETEKDRMVRAEIVRALGLTQNPAAEMALAKSLASDPEPLVRWNAAITLKKFKTLSPEARAVFTAAQKDPSPMVRQTVKGMLP